ncbi:hypothetical protein EX30DRAFT_213768 [Ascodesmis nigricans]|uniref:Uncharacterized protein n=1 Tax=Ascodesmis nigricans TaxID=341454 RepID=A0A4S2MZ23_9PEZI|nr:hypothetical protein EX30DRAFT_213768 [Ascodesmis nigricans]
MAKSRANATATLKTKRPKSPTKRSSATAVQADTPPPTATFDPNFGSPGSVEVHYAGPIEPPSPPSSVDEHHDDGEKVMGVASPILSSSDEEHDHHHNGVAEMISSVEHQNLPPYSLPDCMSQSHYEPGDADYDYDGPVSSMDDPEGEWESDSGPGASFHERKRHGGSDSTNSSASPETISRARKSVTPTSSGKMFQRPPHLSPSSTARRQTGNYFTSRASSANYSDIGMEERKTPLVLLHMSLLLLPGAEEPILRKITPTMLQRGLLIEHPRSDYQLLEELIFDALGLDEPYNLDDDKDEAGSEEDENDLSDTAAWEKSMGIRRIEGRDKWELRIYASNGLMTAGAWRKVWNDMERIDVEIGPRDWRTRKTSPNSVAGTFETLELLLEILAKMR